MTELVPLPSRRSWASRSLFTTHAVDVARVLGTKADVMNAVREIVGVRKARLARMPLIDQLLAKLKE